MTVEQFQALPEREGVRQELIGGEVFETPTGGVTHETVKSRFSRKVCAYCDRHEPAALVGAEAAYRLSSHDAPIPDLSLVLSGTFGPAGTRLPAVIPDLTVEVVSSEAASHLQT